MKDDSLFAFAGIWDHWRTPQGQVIESCAILTTSPNELLIQKKYEPIGTVRETEAIRYVAANHVVRCIEPRLPRQASVTQVPKGHLGGPLEFRLRRTIGCLDG
jgi:hypothetical protein